MSRIRRRLGVDDDIFDIAVWLAEKSESAAARFVDAVQKTLKDLAPTPGMGSLKDFDDPMLANVRTWQIKGFPNHLIYYIAMDDGIDVLAIMHGCANRRGICDNGRGARAVLPLSISLHSLSRNQHNLPHRPIFHHLRVALLASASGNSTSTTGFSVPLKSPAVTAAVASIRSASLPAMTPRICRALSSGRVD